MSTVKPKETKPLSEGVKPYNPNRGLVVTSEVFSESFYRVFKHLLDRHDTMESLSEVGVVDIDEAVYDSFIFMVEDNI